MSKDGGSAFPSEQHECQDNTWNQTYERGMSLRDYFAAHAPEPTKDDVEWRAKGDMQRDPHNDKGLRRSELRIRAAIRYEYADAMLAERAK